MLIVVPGLVEALAPHWSREWAEQAGGRTPTGKEGRVSRRVEPAGGWTQQARKVESAGE